ARRLPLAAGAAAAPGGDPDGGARLLVVARPGATRLLHRRGARGVPAGAPSARAGEPGEPAARALPRRARLPRGGPADRGGPRAAAYPARPRHPAAVRLPARVGGGRPDRLGQPLRAPPRN